MRARAVVPALVVLGAAATAGGALPRWWTVHWTHPLLGAQTSTFTGRQMSPALFALALVAVAGIGAVAAARGWLRRIIGLLVAATGAVTIAAVASGLTSTPAALVHDANPQVERIVGGDRNLVGPLICGLGALLVLAGGALVLAGAFAGRGMGGRFDRSQPPSTASSAVEPSPAEPEDSAAALWKSLDAGHDPTAGDGGTSAKRSERDTADSAGSDRACSDQACSDRTESPGGQDR